jgi:hypothetical protein
MRAIAVETLPEKLRREYNEKNNRDYNHTQQIAGPVRQQVWPLQLRSSNQPEEQKQATQ